MSGSERQRRVLLVLVGALAILGILALVWLLVRQPVQPPVVPPQMIDAAIAMDAARPAPDGAAPHDAAADHKRHSVPTRRITDRELRVLQQCNRASIQVCYDRATRRGSSIASGRADIKVELGAEGRVRSVHVSAGSDRALEGCLRRAVRGWRFSSTLGAQEVRFPVVFR